MSESEREAPPAEAEEPAREPNPRGEAVREAERKRRLARAFGDVLPEDTRDDRPGSWGDTPGESPDEWLRRQVPPHHG